MPETFEKFQNMKYNNIKKYNELKYKYKLKKHYDTSISNGDLSPLIDFDTYKKIDEDIKDNLVGLVTTNGIEVKTYSLHFIDRVCGSVEQKRSGVEIEDIKETINTSKNIKDSRGNNSKKIIGKNNIVSINDKTGNLIQCNPR